MKKKLFSLLMIIAILPACNNKEKDDPIIEDEINFEIDKTEFNEENLARVFTVNVSSDFIPTVNIPENIDWVSIVEISEVKSGNSGNNPPERAPGKVSKKERHTAIKLKIESNRSLSARQATISISVDEKNVSKNIEINQKAGVRPEDDKTIAKGQPYVSFITSREKGSQIIIDVNVANNADKANCWIDLNNNGKRDAGEDIKSFGSHPNSSEGRYTVDSPVIRVYGKLTHFVSGYTSDRGNNLIDLDVSNSKDLTYLYASYNKELCYIDIDNNTKLTTIRFEVNPMLVHLNTSKNTNLEYISLYSCYKVKSVDVRANKKLKDLSLAYTNVTSLDITQNSNLDYLRWHPLREIPYAKGAVSKVIGDLPARKVADKARLLLKKEADVSDKDKAILENKNWELNDSF